MPRIPKSLAAFIATNRLPSRPIEVGVLPASIHRAFLELAAAYALLREVHPEVGHCILATIDILLTKYPALARVTRIERD